MNSIDIEIKQKTETLLSTLNKGRLVQLKESFAKDTWKGYLPLMQNVWKRMKKKYGNIDDWEYINLKKFEDLYCCEYLMNFTRSNLYIGFAEIG